MIGVSRFVVENGRVTEEGGRLRAFQRRRLDEPDVDLYVLAEPAGPKGDDLGAQALEAIGRLFLQDRLSLTGGLLRALRSTHETLLDWNRRSLPRDQVSLGLSAAVVYGDIVYLAQTGPSLAFLRHDGRLERYDANELETAGRPLGEEPPPSGRTVQPATVEVEPVMRRIELSPGDVLIAASTGLQSLVSIDGLSILLERGTDEALPELYLMSRELPNFALFAITLSEPAPDEAAAAEAEAPVETPPPDANSSGQSPTSNGASATDDSTPLINPPPLDISKPVVRLRSDNFSSRSEYPRATGVRQPFRLNLARPRYAVLAAAIALGFFVAAFTVPQLISEDAQAKLASRIEAASVALKASQVEQDPGRKRRLLEDARVKSTEALRIDPQHATALDLRQQAQTALTAMDAVFDLGPLTTLTTLSRQVTGEVSVESLAVSGTAAYLLDSKGGRVIAVPLGAPGTPSVIFQKGETYAGVPAETPRFLLWEGSQQAGRLLVLDAERKLFELRPGSAPGPVPLRRTSAWASVAGIAAYDGNFYVLDPTANQVHRYLPAAAGFDSEPTSALGGQNRLADAQALAVDGDIYVVLKNGGVKRFRGGADAGFSLGGIDRPLKSPTDVAIVGAAGELFIADAGNKRVVVASREGVFRRQFVSNAFTDVRAIAVDPAGAQLYVVVGDALLTAPVVR